MQSIENEQTVSVVHLIWLPYGIELFKNFIDSYLQYESGYPHKLILLFNGIKHADEAAEYHKLALEKNINHDFFYKEKGFDIDIYFWIAPKLATKYVLFLNSYSIILGKDWLQKYIDATKVKNVGMVAATGSYSSIRTNIFFDNTWLWKKGKSFNYNFRKYKLLLKNIFLYEFYFKRFPNPHLRTNAFIISVNLFLSLRHSKIHNKVQAYRFESGRNSISEQVKKKSFELLILDKFGKTYEENNWKRSDTFWTGSQENLLIADNQTNKYQEADKELQQYLTKLAWGIHAEKI